ncbi:MAG: hypothetical protein GWP10_19955 [Nitrospiraceae bacterium]|nr:hypothetical protein [Nitrospiraceae bacterium]
MIIFYPKSFNAYAIDGRLKEIRRRDKMHTTRIMFPLVVLVLLSGTAASADWPMFGHDPQHTGVSGKSVKPPLELLWKYETDGYGAIQNE